MLAEINPASREYAIEKIRWVTANEYAMQYGMSVVEAFTKTVASYLDPQEVSVGFDFDKFKELREAHPFEDRWIFDCETIEGLEMIFRKNLKLEYPKCVLTHMFPTYSYCDILFTRATQHATARQKNS